jgi:hypothetical protein
VPQLPAQRLALQRQLEMIEREKLRPPPPPPPKRSRLLLRAGSLDATMLSIGIGADVVYGGPPFDDSYDADREEAARERQQDQEAAARRQAGGIPQV